MPIELPESVERIYGTERPRYYVMRIGGGPARKPYGSRYKAEEDAVTLASENPGAEFAVVKVKSIFKSNAIVATGSDQGEQVPDDTRRESIRVGDLSEDDVAAIRAAEPSPESQALDEKIVPA